jgi:hypothetical protein
MAEGRKGRGSSSMVEGRMKAGGVSLAAVWWRCESSRGDLRTRQMNRCSYSHTYKDNKVIHENTCIWEMRKNS